MSASTAATTDVASRNTSVELSTYPPHLQPIRVDSASSIVAVGQQQEQQPPEPTLFYARHNSSRATNSSPHSDGGVPQETQVGDVPSPHDADTADANEPRTNLPEVNDVPVVSTVSPSPRANTASADKDATTKAPPADTSSRHELIAPFQSKIVKWSGSRWPRWMFPLYRQVQLPIPFTAPISLIGLLVALLYSLVNLAIFIAFLVSIVTGTGDSSDGRAMTTYNAAVTLGTIGAINYLILMLLANRNSVLTLLLGISFERSILWHKWVARVTVLVLTLHGIGVLVAYWYQGVMRESALDGAGSLNGSGEISLLAGIALVLTSLQPIRRFLFESFLRLHWILFAAFIVFGIIHQGTFIALAAISIVPWVIDWYLRIKVWRKPVDVLAVRALAADVVRIDFDMADFRYAAGQWVFVCIPEVTPLEWHPFSLSSSPHHTSMILHVRALGDWTRRLQRAALARSTDPAKAQRPMRMYVEGPYGESELPQAVSAYKSLLLISGGIGITPMQSTFNTLVHEAALGRQSLNALRFVWSVREASLVHSIHGARLHANSKPARDIVLPASFQPDLLCLHNTNTMETPRHKQPATQLQLSESIQSLVRTTFHLTSGGEPVSEQHIAQLKATYGHSFEIGRPNVYNAVNELIGAARASGDKRVAVLVCGPAELVADVRRAACQLQDKELAVDVHRENFDF